MTPVKWFAQLMRGWWRFAVLDDDAAEPVPAEHVGATENWTPKKELPPDGPLPEEIEAREALAEEQARIDAEDMPVFDDTWDALVAAGVLTGTGADIDTEFPEWTKDDLTVERIRNALKSDDEPTTDDIRISV
jgi:hypothetical protein